MSEKKIKFHPLERLDLVDVDALQEQVLTYMSDVLGNVLGGDSSVRAEGVLKQPTTVTVVNGTGNAYTISFSDFTMMTNVEDADVSRARQGEVIVFDASASYHGTCDFATARNLVQNYYNANGRLPYNPSDSFINYAEASDGQYHPYVWARSADVDLETGNRRFWSVSNGFEITQNVVTRRGKGLEFAVQYAAPAGDGWTKIARIEAWQMNGAVVELSSSAVKFIYLVDNLLPLPTKANGAPLLYASEVRYNEADFGGLMGAVRALAKEVDDMRSVGTYDAQWGISTSNRSIQPLLSMDGLYDAVETLDERSRNNVRKVNGIVTIQMQRTSGNFRLDVTTDYIQNNNSDVVYIEPTVVEDYKLYEIKGRSFPFDPSSTFDALDWLCALSLYSIDFGAQYDGYHIEGNITPLSSISDTLRASVAYDWGIDGGVNNPITTGGAGLGAFQSYPQVWLVSDTQQGTPTEIMKVESRTGKTRTGADSTFYGVRFALGNINEWIDIASIGAETRQWRLAINFTLTKPTEV